MDNQLTFTQTPTRARGVIIPPALELRLKTERKGAGRSVASRLIAFGDWPDATGRQWTTPDLVLYREHMLANGKAPATVNAHLSTIRSRYDDLLHDNAMIAELDAQAAGSCLEHGWEVNPANLAAMVDRVKSTIQKDLNPKRTTAKVIQKQDRAASEFARLSTGQANTLMMAPGTATLVGLRDTTLIALALATSRTCGLGFHPVQSC